MPCLLSRRRLAQALLGTLALQALSACGHPAVQLLTEQRLTLSRAQLQAALAQRFPWTQRVAELLDVRLHSPHLQLLAPSQRIAVELQLDITERLLQSAHPGRLALDFGLRFERTDRSIRMRDVQVQQLVLDKLAPPYQAFMNRYAPRLAERALDNQVLHQLSESDWAGLQRLGLQPAEFRITAQALSLDFQTLPR